jgi:glycosyltransferase involved in cell wall biosynthesis
LKMDEMERSIKIIDYFFMNSRIIAGISKDERDDLMKLICSVIALDYPNEIKSRAITVLYRTAFLDDMSLEEAWQIYWVITSTTFSNSEAVLPEGSLYTLYKYIYSFICSMVNLDMPYRPVESRNQDCIVILVSQFLSEGHAPTIRALDYAYTLKKYLHKEIKLINTGETNFYRNPNLEPSIKFNHFQAYSSYRAIEYKEEKFEFYQVDSEMPNIDCYQNLVDMIYELNPLLVYNIGASSIAADLCTSFTTTASLPCSNQIPVSCSKYLMVGRQLEDADEERLLELESYQKVIETEINYLIRSSDTVYTREQFGIRKDIFLLTIVGNRLDEEITPDFMKLIKEITSEQEGIEVAVVGRLVNRAKLEVLQSDNKIHYLGALEDASEFIKISDLYLNPNRSGGGRSGFEALHYGIPVVTLEFGDVYYTSGKVFSVKNYDDMYKLIIKYCNDKDFYRQMQKQAFERSDILSSLESSLRKAIGNIMEAERGEQ